jgi:DNA-binding NarL/FixJ family response regulator
MHSQTLLIADDHPLILKGNKTYLKSVGFSHIDTAKDGNEAFNKIAQGQYDIAILDMQMPILTGLEVAKLVVQKKLKTRVIILSLHKLEELVQALGTYIYGYVLKEDALEEIVKCIENVADDKTYISQKLAQNIIFETESVVAKKLTAAEFKILQYIAQKKSTQEIAETLFLSPRTIEKHRENIIKKLEIPHGNNNLQLWAIEHKNELI